MNRFSPRINGLPNQGFALYERSEAETYFGLARTGDMVEAAWLWLIEGLVLVLWAAGGDVGTLHGLYIVAVVGLFGIEASSFVKDDRLILRLKTFVWLYMFVKVWGYFIFFPDWADAYPVSDVYEASVLVFFFSAVVASVYVVCGNHAMRGKESWLNRFVPDMDGRAAFALLMLCFVPNLILRLVYVDWKGASSVLLALLGVQGGGVPGSGWLGNWTAIFYPIGWLYTLVPVASGLCWQKCQGNPVVKTLIILIWVFVSLTLLLQRSRALLFLSGGSLLLYFLLVCQRQQKRIGLYMASVPLFFVLVIGANAILQNRNVGVLRQALTGRADAAVDVNADPSTILENDLVYLVGLVNVVPERYAHGNPFWFYYYLAINPIPRFLWPQKPYIDQEMLGEVRPYYGAMSCVGDFYYYGGWLHLLIGALVYGYVMKRLDVFGHRTFTLQGEKAVLYIVLIWWWMEGVRAVWGIVVLGYRVLALMAVLWLIGKLFTRTSTESIPARSLPVYRWQ